MSEHRWGLLAALLVLPGCAARQVVAPPAAAPAAPPPVLPALPVAQVAERTALAGTTGAALPADPLAGLGPGEPVTISAAGVDIRVLLPLLAEAAGFSLVLGPEVQGRVSVNLNQVPAVEALRAVLAESRLTVAGGPPAAPSGPVVFYVLPVDVERASAALIQARFGVSRELAEFIVRNRIPR